MKTAFYGLISLVFSLATISSQAASLFWDGGSTDILTPGDGASAGGSGIWSTSITNWDAGIASNHVAWGVGGNNHIANFGGSGGTVTFGADLGPAGAYPNSIFFSTGNYVFDLGTNGLSFRGSGLVVSNTATLVLTNGTMTILSAGVSVTGPNALKVYSKVSSDGVVGMAKFGAGDVYLYNDANDFTGPLLGQNGFSVHFASIKNSGVPSAAGAGSVLQTGENNTMNYIGSGDSSDRTLSLFGGGNDFVNSSGSGALIWTGPFDNTKSGASILTFGGSNTSSNEFRGNLTNSALGALSVSKGNNGTWILSGTNTYTGVTTIGAGVLRIVHGLALGDTNGTVQSGNSALEIDGAISPVIVGAEALSINGTGIANGGALRNIAGNNTFGGTVTLAAESRINSDSGTLTLDNPVAVAGAGQNVIIGGAGNVTIPGGITALNVTKDGTGTLTLPGTNTYAGTTTIIAGKVLLGGGLSTNINQVVVTGTDSSLILTNGARLFTTNGMIFVGTSGTIALYSNTVWNMRGVNTNPGNQVSGTSNRFLVADGAIVTNTFGVGNTLVVNGNYCTLEVVNGGKVYWQNGGVLFGQGATRNNRILIGGSGAPAYMQSLGVFQIPQNGGTIANYGVIVSNGVWDAGPVYLGRSVSTGNYIHVFAAGVVNFNGQGLFINDTGAGISNYLSVAGGLVTNVSQISVNSNNSMSVDGGTIAAGANGTLLTGAGNAYVGAGGATIDTVAFTTTIAMGLNEDPLSTGGGLIKRGSGTLTLFAVNTYSGDTTISEGTLTLVAPGSIGNSPLISVAAGATFNAGSGFALDVGQTLAGEGTVVSDVEIDGAVSPGIAGIGTLTASNSVTWNAGVAWPYDLGAASASDRLSINGDFTMGAGAEGEFEFDLQGVGVAGVYTLVTWTASTTFDDGSEFSAINVPGGLTPSFTVNANELLLTLSGDGGGFSAGSTNTSIALVSGQVTFGFNIASGALYHVQASTNLLSVIDNGFTNITGPLTNPGTATLVYTNTSSDPTRMFRINSP